MLRNLVLKRISQISNMFSETTARYVAIFAGLAVGRRRQATVPIPELSGLGPNSSMSLHLRAF